MSPNVNLDCASMIRVVGRSAELTTVDLALDRVSAGFAALIISGEPGSGKTTVWRYGIVGAIARGYRVASCRAAGSQTWRSFCGLANLLEQAPKPALDGLDHRAISTAVTGVIRRLAAAGPVVVAVDDLQWLDTATAEILAYMFRRLSREPVLFMGAALDSPGEAPSAELAHALDDDRITRVRLGP